MGRKIGYVILGVVAVFGVALIIAGATAGQRGQASPTTPPLPSPSSAVASAAPVPPSTRGSLAAPAPAAPTSAPAAAPAPAAEPSGPATTVGNGTWEVGTDVAPGKYKSDGVDGSLCYYDQTNESGRIVDQGVAPEGPSRTTLKKGLTFKSSGCQDWVKVG